MTCHNAGSGARGPALTGLYGSQVKLAGGAAAVADEGYLRQSIEDPRARQVLGYEPLMPTYKGMISEEGMLQIIEYIKSLGPGPTADRSPADKSASDASAAGRCDTAKRLVGEAQQQLAGLPRKTSRRLKANLGDWLDHLQQQIGTECKAPENATPEPTETVTPEPTETATPEPTETATPAPTETASPEPTVTTDPGTGGQAAPEEPGGTGGVGAGDG